MSKNLENIDKLKNINSQSALKEAAERRKNKKKNKKAEKEIDGREGPEPTCYNDWEKNGIHKRFLDNNYINCLNLKISTLSKRPAFL